MTTIHGHKRTRSTFTNHGPKRAAGSKHRRSTWKKQRRAIIDAIFENARKKIAEIAEGAKDDD